jgi:hypothetical protein
MTDEERTRGTIEHMAKGRKEFNDSREGVDTSYDRAEREIRGILKDKLNGHK